ncbi:uroporphyrinogen-III synthase [Litoreibacter janthinus]|uniref:Uroporphyrinogen-III synthase n=1 Tax=Litoreibacter janthinus TaxID=670154 RepID=A0A1I6FVU6_9RHOB|nr:uroporphyrinogen-III synthase [Litoreibacter janthinus]SFR34072.1 uroporphyrinogen-III synthase [Litoreibacter janthinus]
MAQTIPSTVLLTRPLAASERFAAELRAPVVISPLMETVWIETAPLTAPPDAVAFTSQNGVEGFIRCQSWRGTAYCVGDRTAQAAKEAGFDAESAEGDIADLTALLAKRAPGAALVHARGRHVAGELGVRAVPLVVYEQRVMALTPEARKLLSAKDKVILPLFSPRSATLFAKQLTGAEQAQLVLVAMSEAVAQACTDSGMPVACIADAPDAASMKLAIEAVRG